MKVILGTEVTLDAVRLLLDVAMGYPRKGMHLGGGRHVDMPDTWDGQGATPPGWTKHACAMYVGGALDAALQLDDDQLSASQASASLSALEKSQILTLSLGRVTTNDPGNGDTRPPKANGAATRGEVAAKDD